MPAVNCCQSVSSMISGKWLNGHKPVGGLAGRAVSDAGFTQMPVGGGESPFDVGGRKAAKASKNRVQTARGAPSCPIYSSGIPGSRAYRASIALSGAGPDGLCSPDYCLARLSRHRHPAQIIAGATSASRASKGVQLYVLWAANRPFRGLQPRSGTGPRYFLLTARLRLDHLEHHLEGVEHRQQFIELARIAVDLDQARLSSRRGMWCAAG